MSKRIVLTLLLATLATACTGDKEPDAYGNFEAEEVVVSAEMGGQLEWFTPMEGMRLAANATVGLIDSTQTALEIQQNVAQREGIRSRLGEATQNINVLEVQRGIARRNYERTRRLFSQRAATAQQLDQAERDYRVLVAQIQAAQAQRQSVGEDIRSADARIAQIRDRQSKARVINPKAGTVLATYAKAGEVVAPGKPLYKIANLDTMNLRAYITADQLAKTRLGQTVQVHVDQSDGKLMTLPGTVTWIASKAEFTPTPIQTRDQRTDLVYAVKVRVANPQGVLKIGMPADLDIPAAPPESVSDIVVGRDLNKSFGRVHALSDISLDVHDGELFGIVGPDGAGKTTLFRILVTLLLPDSGTATVLGLDVVKDYREIRRRVGYMPGTFSLYPDLSVAENIEFFASVFGTTLTQGYDLIAPVYKQIEPFKDRRAAALSGGMKQKLALCCALVHRPDILFLDEPTTGVDAVSRREFWDQLGRLKESGLTILVSTPYMDEAVRCDRVALMQVGKLLAVDTPAAISRQYDRPLIAISGARRYEMLLALRELPTARSVYPFGDSLHYTDARADVDTKTIVAELEKYLHDCGFSDAKAEPIEAGIEDSFMALMGDKAEAA